jgi:hypothetical protein
MNRQSIQLEIGLELPDHFENYDETTQQSIIQYLKQLEPIERKAYSIGKQHLGSSFNVVKSNGYNNWKKKS